MSDYISREAARKLICARCGNSKGCGDERFCPFICNLNDIPAADVVERASGIIGAIPAADVREVVLCRDCRYAYDSVGGWCCSHGVCVDCIVREDFFCADGEKREES